MDDDKLKFLFSDFDPELSSDLQFMSRLQRNLNSVEIIKQHAAEIRSKNRRAVIVAACVGVIVGLLFSLALPAISDAVSNWQLTLPDESVIKTIARNFTVIAWIIIGSVSVLTALNTYDLLRSLPKLKNHNHL